MLQLLRSVPRLLMGSSSINTLSLPPRMLAAASTFPSLRAQLHSSRQVSLPAPCSNNPGHRIPKTHSGAKKRFTAVGSSKGLPIFKRGKVGKRHLNTHMSGNRLNGLGGTTIERLGQPSRMIRRLLGPRL